jgi:hypothetical protein
MIQFAAVEGDGLHLLATDPASGRIGIPIVVPWCASLRRKDDARAAGFSPPLPAFTFEDFVPHVERTRPS